jgi:anti-anti-sigma factor
MLPAHHLLGIAGVEPVGGVEVVSLPHICVLRLVGEHDVASTATLTSMIETALKDVDVIVDLNEAEFIDSSVIHAFACGCRAARSCGRQFLVCVRSDHRLHRVLALTELGRQFPIVEDADAAQEKLARTGTRSETIAGRRRWWSV